jgi:putative flippase GtrA
MSELTYTSAIVSTRQETVKQFLRFAVVGVSNTLVDFAVYFFLTRTILFFSANIYIANVLAFIIAATWSYVANRTWTFKVESPPSAQEALKFYFATASTFLLNMATFYLTISTFGLYDLVAKLVATVVSMVSNFVLNKLWVFSHSQK